MTALARPAPMPPPPASAAHRPEVALLAACACLELDADARARIAEALSGGIDWDAAIALAARNGVVAFLHRHLVTAPAAAVPDEAAARVRERFRHDAHRALRLSAELRRIVDHLTSTGIDSLPYKGPTLAMQAYGDLSLRAYVDLDLLVRPGDAPRALAVLAEMGFASVHAFTPAQDRLFRRVDGDYPLLHRETGTLLELHCRPSSERFLVPIDTAELMRRAVPVALGGTTVPAPAPDDLLLILAAHGAKHRWKRLEWVCAVAELLRRGAGDPSALLARSTELHARRTVLLAFSLAHRLLRAPLPDGVLREMEGDGGIAALAAEAEARMFSPAVDGEDGDETAANLAYNLRARDGAVDRARYAWRWLTVPSPEDWAWRALPDALFPAYRVLRPLRLLFRHALPRRRTEER